MNLENGRVILEDSRVIGIREGDKLALQKAAEKKESSFTSSNEPMIQDQPIVQVVPEIMPDMNPGYNNMQQPVVETPKVVEPIEPVVPSVQPMMQPDFGTQVSPTNIFDTGVMNQNSSGDLNANAMKPNPVDLNVVQPSVNQFTFDEVQGGVTNNNSSELDTPQTFFDSVEKSNMNTPSNFENSNASYDDPAIIMLDNVRDIVNRKNQTIEALNKKIDFLQNQLNKAEEDRKVSEAQRMAAETTLAQARGVNPMQGPSLVYQQQPGYQNQNYGQAA